jgi:glycosyltransferase involved in cell wall biosynthesis
MGMPSLGSPDLLGKIKRKLRSYAKPVRRTAEGLLVVTPFVIPFYSSRLNRAINRLLLICQIKLLMIAFDFAAPILWIAIPTAGELAGRLGERLLIYHVSDKYEANQMDHATSREVVGSMHRSLLTRADLIYYSGRKLLEEETRDRPNIVGKAKLLEQAVDFEHFASASAPNGANRDPITEPATNIPADIAGVPEPRLGFFGSLDSWLLDQELIKYVSRKRPDWHWVMLGIKVSRLSIEDLPNVHCLGPKPYGEVPAYARLFQVCVLPWVTDNEWVGYGSAIKVREYLATGKPVVITTLYEFEPLDGILRIARDYDDFIRKIEDSLARDTEADRLARQQAVKSSTWDVRAEEVSEDIEALI